MAKSSSRDDKVGQILSKYGLDRGLAQAYIEKAVYLNQTDTAEAMGVSRQTVRNYKEKFEEMNRGERVYLIAQFGEECLMDLVHEVARPE